MSGTTLLMLFLVVASGLTVSEPAHAGSATGTLLVSVTVQNSCSVSTSALAFETYDKLSARATDGTGAVQVTCSPGAVTTVGLSSGMNASGSQRRMRSAEGSYINYQVYKEVARTSVWGNSGGALLDTGVAPNGRTRTFDVYGRIPAGQEVPAGTYTDLIITTVNF